MCQCQRQQWCGCCVFSLCSRTRNNNSLVIWSDLLRFARQTISIFPAVQWWVPRSTLFRFWLVLTAWLSLLQSISVCCSTVYPSKLTRIDAQTALWKNGIGKRKTNGKIRWRGNIQNKYFHSIYQVNEQKKLSKKIVYVGDTIKMGSLGESTHFSIFGQYDEHLCLDINVNICKCPTDEITERTHSVLVAIGPASYVWKCPFFHIIWPITILIGECCFQFSPNL